MRIPEVGGSPSSASESAGSQFATAAWQSALDAAKGKQGFTDGYNIVTYGNDNGAVTVTDTTGNAQGPQAIVTFDRGTDTGTVTQLDPSTGKPMLDYNGKVLQDTITENGPGGALTVKGNLDNFEIIQYGFGDPTAQFTFSSNPAMGPPVDIGFNATNNGGDDVNQLGVGVFTPSTTAATQGTATPQDLLIMNSSNTQWIQNPDGSITRNGPDPADHSIISSTFYPQGDSARTTDYTSPAAPSPGFDWNPLSWF